VFDLLTGWSVRDAQSLNMQYFTLASPLHLIDCTRNATIYGIDCM